MLNRLAVVLLACFSLGFHYSIDVRADPAELPADCTYIFNQGTGLCLYHNPGRPGSAFLIDCTRDDAETTIGHFWRVVPTDLPLDEPQYPHSRGVPVHIQACREWYPSDPPVELHVLSRQSTGAVSMMDLFTMSDSSDAIWYSWRGQLWSYDATRALSVSASGPYLALIGRVQFAWSAQSVEDSADPEQWQESEKNGVLEHHCPSCLFNTTITWTYESPTVQVRPRRRSHQASDRNLCMIAPQRHPYETYWYGLFNDRTLMVFNGCDERSPHNVVENSRSYHYQKWLAAVRCEGSHGVDSSVLLSTGQWVTLSISHDEESLTPLPVLDVACYFLWPNRIGGYNVRVDYCEDAVDSTLTADSWDMSPPDYPVTPNCDTRGYNTHVCREGHPAPGCMMWEGPEETPTEQCPAETDPEHHDLSVGKSFHLMQLDPESLQNRSWHQMGSQAPSIGWHYWPSQQNWVLRMWYEMVSFLAPQVSRVVVTAADYIVSGPAQLNTGTGTCPASRTTVVDLALRPSSMPGPPRSYLVDAGHVLGRQLGGPGHDPLCVFPQSVAANRGAFAQLEGRVRDHVQVTGRPVIGSIRFDHDLTAQNQNGFAPSQFEITVQDANDPLQFYEHLHFWNLLAGQPILAPAPPTALPPIVDHPPPEPIGGPTSTWQQSWITIVVAIGVALLLLVILVCCYVRALKFPNRPTSSFSPPRLPVLVTIIPQMATSAPAQPAPLDGLTVTSEPASAPIRLHLAPSLTTGMVQQQLTLADQTRQEHHLPKQQAVQDESDV